MIRELLVEITGSPHLVSRIAPEEDLLTAGVGSGDMIRLVAALEERFGVEIGLEDLDRLKSMAAFERFAADAVAAAGRSR